ncbi:MAG TPA: glycogen/starch synthase, partial [Planctomycetota bacterium]|nr:glycogen/starch synthase [Planctomycetota bacterium]
MHNNFTLFETSWEVAQKVGGIHTVIATKARGLVGRLGDRYVCVGPWTLTDPERAVAFAEERGFEGFADSCRALGVPVRVGRWEVPGRPRTVLVDASGLNAKKDDLFKDLWDRYRVDSLFGGWDYAEPTLFGLAAATVIERWWQEFVAPRGGEAVAQFHEWMTSSGMLQLKQRVPSIGTVFTTHATVLGRALGAAGQGHETGLAGRTPDAAAEALGVRSKHSLEAAAAREADVLTTVSELTADEVEFFLRRRAQPVLVNGIDLESVDTMAARATRETVHPALQRLAAQFLGEDMSDAALLAAAGRYEFHNKGYDVVLSALGRVAKEPGRRAVLFLLVPAGHAGIRKEVLDRVQSNGQVTGGALGLCTHKLFDADGDAIARACKKAGLDNAPGSRVKVIHVAGYLSADDGLLGLPWEASLRGLDLTLFPSFYEPWGYTPVESLVAGVPTITSDLTGFGGWALGEGRGTADGVTILPRRHRTDAEAEADLAGIVSRFLAGDPATRAAPTACRSTASLLAWSKALTSYDEAFGIALARAADRALGPARAFAARVPEAGEGTAPHFVDFEV